MACKIRVLLLDPDLMSSLNHSETQDGEQYDLIHTEPSTLLSRLLGDEYDGKGKLIRNDLNLICHANESR